MWVKLLVTKTIEVDGTSQTYHPGDWITVGKQSAMVMIAASEAIIANQDNLASIMPAGAHVLLTRDPDDGGKLLSRLEATKLPFAVLADGAAVSLLHSHMLILQPDTDIKVEMIPIGFRLLEKWQMAVPIGDYHEMAIQIGTPADRDITEAVIRDLRVPYYDTRMIFVKRCADTKAFFETWGEELLALRGKTDARLAFLRAMYKVKPILCALPTLWSRRE